MNSLVPVYTPVSPEDSRPDYTHIHQENPRFGATQVSGGISLQGNFVGVTINSTARPDYRGQFSHSSLEPVKAFVPRPLLRDQIRTQLCDDAADETTKTLVVWGLAGAGKSQLVLDYVRQYRTDYKATLWIEAGRKESLDRDFVNLYQTLFGVQTVARKETVSVESAVIGVKSWLSGQRGPWLMVFDGADTIENEEASEYINIKHFIPDVASLHVIVTSRSGTAKDTTRLEGVQVGEMEEAQAAELFYRYSQLRRNHQDIENEEVKAIVKEFGYLALAVTLAGTYVGQTPRLQSDIKAYLPEYRLRRRELLKRNPERLIHQYSESVLTTWETSYQAIIDYYPEASTLMTMLSFLSFDDIFLQLFSTGLILSTGSIDDAATVTWRSILFPGQVVDIYRMEECFKILQKYSFVQWKADQQSYTMHKLVHAWGYDRLPGDEQYKFSVTTLSLVVEAMNGCRNAPEDKLRLVPHMMANFATIAGARGLSDRVADGTLDILERIGVFLTDIGRLPEGRVIKEFIWTERRRLLGEEHPSTISAMDNLANTFRDLGQLDEAMKMEKKVLEKRRRILGEEHSDTISTMSNLAIILRDLGQPNEAMKMNKKVLEKRRHILNEEHLDTILAINNLANTLEDLGQPNETMKMRKEVLEKRRRILGEEHPDTISTMSNLAVTFEDLGQPNEAVKMNKEVLEKRRHILNEEHLDTILAMSNLANTLGDLGQPNEAMKMKKEVLEKLRRILGEEHPDTILVMSNLAVTLRDLGQLDEAMKMKKEVLEKRRRILDKEHPDTILAMSNLANTLEDLGQPNEAMKMKKEVLEKRRRILSEKHPDTILAMSNLAVTLGDLGQLDEAMKMNKEVLEKRRRILGEEHLDTILAMNNLANTLGDLGQPNKAVALLEVAEEKMRRIRGDQHPYSKVVARNLARFSAGITAQNAEASNSKERKKGYSFYNRIKRRLRK